jgi:2-polyprenyl-6-methoxyphenol hydroxylase-like FAD-dependent oxidoreductase
MRVALLANLKKNAPSWPGMSPDQWDDLDSEETIEAIVDGLRTGGHEAEFIEADLSLVETLPGLQARYLLQHRREPLGRQPRVAGAGFPGDAAHPLHRLAGHGAGAGAGQSP